MADRICWHFAAATLRDGTPLPRKNNTLKHKGEVVPCESGYHGSERAIDALAYAPGAMVARVRLCGTVVAHGEPVDKYAASERTNLTNYADATRVLHEFACWCATAALNREEAEGRTVDPRSRTAIEVKLAWLDGKATDAELAAAWSAAWFAAVSATNATAWFAANATTWSAASAAASAATNATTWSAASAAARSATCAAQNAELERRLVALVEADRG